MYRKKYIKSKRKKLEAKKKAPKLIKRAVEYVGPLVDELQGKIDKRLTYTLFDSFMGMLHFRDRANSLLLSELGACVNGPKHAPAGTKRLSNLLREENWSYEDVKKFLLEKTKKRLGEKGKEGKRWLLHWDDSVIEKPESLKIEGLCSVHSSKGARLTRIKPGFYTKYPRINVSGFEWSAGVLSSLSDRPTITCMDWWTKRGKHRDTRENVLYRMLQQSSEMIKQTQAEVWHVFDRGYANRRTLDYMINHFQQSFIIRWKSNHLLLNEKGELKQTYRHSIGKKITSTRRMWDKERKEWKRVGIVYTPVHDPEINERQLYLVIVRDKKKGRSPIYFLTDVKIDTNGMAWSVLKSYMKRWDVEQVFRFGKSAMGIQSPRLWFWENRLKLLMLVTLVMDFVLTLLSDYRKFSRKIIDTWCPRTGKRQKNTFLPLYRLRIAISWLISCKIVPT